MVAFARNIASHSAHSLSSQSSECYISRSFFAKHNGKKGRDVAEWTISFSMYNGHSKWELYLSDSVYFLRTSWNVALFSFGPCKSRYSAERLNRAIPIMIAERSSMIAAFELYPAVTIRLSSVSRGQKRLIIPLFIVVWHSSHSTCTTIRVSRNRPLKSIVKVKWKKKITERRIIWSTNKKSSTNRAEESEFIWLCLSFSLPSRYTWLSLASKEERRDSCFVDFSKRNNRDTEYCFF